MNYIEELEKQNEELKETLAKSQEEVVWLTEEITAKNKMDPLDLFIEKMSGDFNYRVTMKMFMKKSICDNTPLSQDKALEVIDAVMYDVFKQGRG